ncbi:MAG: hypothetical protein PVG60_03860 [Desulfarculaceae bacterium]
MAAPPLIDLSASSLTGALPEKPEDLYRLHRLCLRIYGLLARDVPAQAQALTKAAGSSLRKKDRKALAQALEEELPVLIALYAQERLAKDPRLAGQGLADLLRGLLLPCFSLSYQHLYEQPADPLKHVLARVDWYLDGDKGEPLAAFLHFINAVSGARLGEEDPLVEHLKGVFLPELDSRLELAFRYEFG